MKVTTELLKIVQQAHSVHRILDAAVSVVRESFQADACSAFVIDEAGALVLQSSASRTISTNPDRAGASSIAREAIASHRVVTSGAEGSALIAAPMQLRDTALGALVVEDRGGREFAAKDRHELTTICAHLAGIVQNARIVAALDRGETPPLRLAPPAAMADATRECTLLGVAASPGIASGKATFRTHRALKPAAGPPVSVDPGGERLLTRTAMEKTRNDVLRVQSAVARELDEDHALIFASHLLLLQDAVLLGNIERRILGGATAALAIDGAFRELEERLSLVADTYIQERVDDIDDLRSRLLGHVLHTHTRARFDNQIVLTQRIAPSLVVEMKSEGARALVSETGGATSHGVLLARALGIPTVTGVVSMLEATQSGDELIVDGTNGIVTVRPVPDTMARYAKERQRLERERTEHAKFRNVLACTRDGVRVRLLANVAVGSDLRLAHDNGAEGIGLYRTEFPFMLRDAFPTLSEQTRLYAKAYELFPAGPIQFRILDLGGDKFALGGPITAARGAFNGYRSIRVLFDHPDVLRDQVQALVVAAGERPLRILIPMLTSMEELRRVKALISSAIAEIDGGPTHQPPEIGAMIETPAAVELAVDIAQAVNFISIGTNDLMQYTLVADREDSRMAHLADPYHPAIWRMIARVVAAAVAANKPVGVCGEMASRPDVALALVALGVDSLSVVPGAIPELKQALAGASVQPMKRALSAILASSDASSLASALRAAQSAGGDAEAELHGAPLPGSAE